MNTKQAQKQETHERILEAAGRLFRTQGYQGAGIQQIMDSIGMTVGGFYNHFESKEALFNEGVDRAISGIVESAQAGEKPSDPAKELQVFVEMYLSQEHRDNVGDGCILPSLSPDVARADGEVQRAYTRFVKRIADKFVKTLPESTDCDPANLAWALMAMLVGGLMMSRAVEDSETSDRILEACRESALAILKEQTRG